MLFERRIRRCYQHNVGNNNILSLMGNFVTKSSQSEQAKYLPNVGSKYKLKVTSSTCLKSFLLKIHLEYFAKRDESS